MVERALGTHQVLGSVPGPSVKNNEIKLIKKKEQNTVLKISPDTLTIYSTNTD